MERVFQSEIIKQILLKYRTIWGNWTCSKCPWLGSGGKHAEGGITERSVARGSFQC